MIDEFKKGLDAYVAKPYTNSDNIKGFTDGWYAKEQLVRKVAIKLATVESVIEDNTEVKELIKLIVRELMQ